MVKRFEVYLVNLDQEPSDDPRNTRPCVVVSPDEMNRHISHVIVAPLTTTDKDYPTRVKTDFLNGERTIVLDQVRTVNRVRMVKRIGEIEQAAGKAALERLREMFAE
jgi:mRNA interferase MazF